MTQDQVFVPKTRTELHLPALDPAKEDPVGRSVANEVKQELWEALGDSPIGATLGAMSYLVGSILFCWHGIGLRTKFDI
jgi:omega-6 fatty acid desaturase (delta-12 desaturase)